ncbi:histone-lysine N-methyltransferase SETMAR-like [Panonychus citri]|uniref:histone-lysine N-methyltransferase SETMAR-like n=1 Tax=Panonychus citri TaxID=50023 RepID=UPI0023070F95|nr:histone-lysine N-methyltransferase SETMAR-like [Panonychus citri]
MDLNFDEIYHVLINRFRIGENSAEAYRYLCFSYGTECLSERQCRRWFVKFRNGNFEVKRSPGQGRKMTLNLDHLREIIQSNPRQSTRELAIVLNVCQKTISNGLKKINFTNKRGTWIPHDLSDANKALRLSIVRTLVQRFKTDPFLDRVVTCDEKWVLYNNVHLRKQWLPKGQSPESTPLPGLHPKKVLISVFWDYRGIIHYELLPEGQTINADVYCSQLDRLSEQLSLKKLLTY